MSHIVRRRFIRDRGHVVQKGKHWRNPVHFGLGYLRATGVSTSYAETPDHNDFDITTELDIRMCILPTIWPPGGTNGPSLLARWEVTGDQRAYKIGASDSGRLRVTWSTNGVNFPELESSIVASLSTTQPTWIRVTFDPNDGSQSIARFYTSTDPPGTDPSAISWSQLGTDAIGTISSIFGSSTSTLRVGQRPGDGLDADPFDGRILYAEIRNGIGGTIVANPDFRYRTDYDPLPGGGSPTFVAEYENTQGWGTTTSPKTVSVTTGVGDGLVIVAAKEAGGPTDVLLPTGGTPTYTNYEIQPPVEDAAQSWIRADATSAGVTAQSYTLSQAFIAATLKWGFTAVRFSGFGGIGAAESRFDDDTPGEPTLDITTTEDNSALVVIAADWNAADGATRTWRTVNGFTPSAGNGAELVYFRDSAAYTVYVAYYPDAGAAGLKTVGLSAPGGQKYTIAAVEAKGTAGVASHLTDSTGKAWTISSPAYWVLPFMGEEPIFVPPPFKYYHIRRQQVVRFHR